MTFDLKSASMHGTHTFGRVRVLWRDGMLKAYDRVGPVLEIRATEPKRKPGYLRAWESSTDNGPILIKPKCITCGGRAWWKIMRMSENDLWAMEW